MADPQTRTEPPADSPAAHGAPSDPHGGVRKYIAVAIALTVLTSASFLTYFPFWDQHVPDHVSRAFMMAVSCAKAMLVLLFFMHLLWEANWKYVLTIPAVTLAVFLVLMLVPDIGRRTAHYSEERLLHAAQPRVQPDSSSTHPGASHDGRDGAATPNTAHDRGGTFP